MSAISSQLVRELREKTNAGMMDCKRALTEAGGDLAKAEDILRAKGIASAGKKASRSAKEGIVASYIHLQGKVGVLVEVNCETDFVAKNENFREFVKDITLHVAAANPICVSREQVDPSEIEREKAIYRQQVEGKPAEIIEKIVDGKVEKFYGTICLLEQPFTVAARPLPGLAGRILQAARQFRATRFRLWHSFHYLDDYTEPLIARAAGARAWVYTKKNMSWGGRAWRVRTALAARVAAQNATMLERFFAQPTAREKVRLIPLGVDTELFRPAAEPRLRVRQQLGLAQDAFLLGCVAHLVPIKGHPALIQALARTPEAHLALAGSPRDGEYAAGLHRLCAELRVSERVHFLGTVGDISALHAELDAFVLPTVGGARGEGCPAAMLEAMACGLPCIATNVPGSQDIIEPGRSGLLVPAGDVAALADAIHLLAVSPEQRHSLGEAARARVLARYTIDREVAQYEALYAELLKL